MSKVTTRPGVDPQVKIDELRKLANTDYFDIMLLHYQHVASWPTDTERWQDGIAEAQSKKIVIGRGASVHGLPALRRFPGNQWLEIAMIRMNHKGTKMDAEDYNTSGPGNVNEVVSHLQQAHAQGMGVISMKLAGEGAFTPGRPEGGEAFRVPARRGRRRNGGIQEHRGDRRSDRESESGPRVGRAFIAAPHALPE